MKNNTYLCNPKTGDSLAQQVEHNTFNVGVLGSSPRRITKENFERDSLFFVYIRTQDPIDFLMEHTPCVLGSSSQADHKREFRKRFSFFYTGVIVSLNTCLQQRATLLEGLYLQHSKYPYFATGSSQKVIEYLC